MLIRTIVALGFVMCLASAPAAADEWGSQDADTGAHPDGGFHTYCYASSLPAGLEANIYQAESHSLDYHTQADVSYDSSCVLSGSGQTDVRWLEGDLPGTVRGQAPCAVWRSNGHCDRYNVTLDLAEINEGTDDEYDQNKTACHELGHTVGLSHGNADCMITGERPSLADQWQEYGTHHTDDHINEWF